MTARLDDGTIRLIGDCPVEDAEALAALLSAHPGSAVDLTGCGTMNTAVFQLLLALQPPLVGAPSDEFARNWLFPLLTTDLSADAATP